MKEFFETKDFEILVRCFWRVSIQAWTEGFATEQFESAVTEPLCLECDQNKAVATVLQKRLLLLRKAYGPQLLDLCLQSLYFEICTKGMLQTQMQAICLCRALVKELHRFEMELLVEIAKFGSVELKNDVYPDFYWKLPKDIGQKYCL